MKALIINLDRETQRLAFQTKQLTSLGLEYDRIPAVVIQDKHDNDYQKYYKSWQRPLSISEVSCFFSHKKAWEVIVSENQPMLILEDDAWLANNLPCILKELITLKNIDYVTLEVTGANRKKLVAKEATASFCDVNLLRLFQGRSGAGGYILWPSGAKLLIEQFNEGQIGLSDKFINSCYSLRAYQIEPATVIQLDQCQFYGITPPLEVKTTIVNKSEFSVPLLDHIRFRLRRIIGEIKIGVNFLKNRNHSIKRHISLTDYFKNS